MTDVVFQPNQVLKASDVNAIEARSHDATTLTGLVPVASIPGQTADALSAAGAISNTDQILVTQPSLATGPTQLVRVSMTNLLAFLQSNLTFGSGGTSTTITVNAVGNQNTGQTFTVSGTMTGYSAPPTLRYSDNGGSTWTAFPGGASVTNTTFSFTHPSIATAINGITVKVTDSLGVTVGTSAPFNVATAPTSTVSLNTAGPVNQGTAIPLAGNWTNNQPTAMDYTTDNGTTWVAISGFAAVGGGTWSGTGPTINAPGSVNIKVRDHNNTAVISNTITVTINTTETLSLSVSSPMTVNTVMALSGTWTNDQPASLDYTIDNGSTWQVVTSFSATGAGNWTGNGPTPSATGTVTIKVRDHTYTTVVSNSVNVTVQSAGASVPALPTFNSTGQTVKLRLYSDVPTGQFYTNTALTTQAVAGNNVLGVRDTSPASNNLANTPSNAGAVLTANTVNGKNGLVFTVGSSGLETDSAAFVDSLRTSTNVTIFAVFKFNDSAQPGMLFRAGYKGATDITNTLAMRVSFDKNQIYGGRCGGNTINNFPLVVYGPSLSPNPLGSYVGTGFKIVWRTTPTASATQKVDGLITDFTTPDPFSFSYTNGSGDADTNSSPWEYLLIGGQYLSNTLSSTQGMTLMEFVIWEGTTQVVDSDVTALLNYAATQYGF